MQHALGHLPTQPPKYYQVWSHQSPLSVILYLKVMLYRVFHNYNIAFLMKLFLFCANVYLFLDAILYFIGFGPSTHELHRMVNLRSRTIMEDHCTAVLYCRTNVELINWIVNYFPIDLTCFFPFITHSSKLIKIKNDLFVHLYYIWFNVMSNSCASILNPVLCCVWFQPMSAILSKSKLGVVPPCINVTGVTAYLNLPAVRKALHIAEEAATWEVCR